MVEAQQPEGEVEILDCVGTIRDGQLSWCLVNNAEYDETVPALDKLGDVFMVECGDILPVEGTFQWPRGCLATTVMEDGFSDHVPLKAELEAMVGRSEWPVDDQWGLKL